MRDTRPASTLGEALRGNVKEKDLRCDVRDWRSQLAFVSTWIALAIYVAVAIMWLDTG